MWVCTFFVILVLLECRYYERLYVAHAGYRVRQASLRVIGVATAAALDLFQYMSQYLQFAVSFSFLHCQNPTKVVLTLLAVSCFMVDLSSATTMLFLHSKIWATPDCVSRNTFALFCANDTSSSESIRWTRTGISTIIAISRLASHI